LLKPKHLDDVSARSYARRNFSVEGNMRLALCFTSLFALASCDTTTTSSPSPDLSTAVVHDLSGSGSTPTLTVNNTDGWCTVTVTVGSGTPMMFSTATDTVMAAAGTTITLSATPNPGFTTVKWTGVTTMSGPNATYVMTSAAAQSITACCPFTNGTGC
jgi:hypothetical protein